MSASRKCHWPGCERRVSGKNWACREHWFKLPSDIRKPLLEHYDPERQGQVQPTKDYLSAATMAGRWIESHMQRHNIERELKPEPVELKSDGRPVLCALPGCRNPAMPRSSICMNDRLELPSELYAALWTVDLKQEHQTPQKRKKFETRLKSCAEWLAKNGNPRR